MDSLSYISEASFDVEIFEKEKVSVNFALVANLIDLS